MSNSIAPRLAQMADIKPDWPGIVAEIVAREGRAVRAGTGNTIEAKSLADNRWAVLQLPSGAKAFEKTEDRDTVLDMIIRGAKA